jgi:hypothetical protein
LERLGCCTAKLKLDKWNIGMMESWENGQFDLFSDYRFQVYPVKSQREYFTGVTGLWLWESFL